VAADVAELTMVHEDQGEERQRHAEEIEEERRSILEGVFDKDESRSPNEDDCQ
jgi:hypothetical protein